MRENQGDQLECMAAGCNRMRDSSRCERIKSNGKCPLEVKCPLKFIMSKNNFRLATFKD